MYMKTHIEIDDHLLSDAMRLGQCATKKETIHAALAAYVRGLKRAELLALKGKLPWRGDLDALRAMRPDKKRR